MKKIFIFVICLLFVCQIIFSQTNEEEIMLIFGPRVGVSFIILDQKDFNAEMQKIFGSENEYYPFFSELGLTIQQLIPLKGSNSYLSFYELFSLGGMDQNMALPSFNFLIGYKHRLGFEFAIGPYFTIFDNSGKLKMDFSLTYMLGWSLINSTYSVPINLMFIPYPSYGNPRFTLTVGINFNIKD